MFGRPFSHFFAPIRLLPLSSCHLDSPEILQISRRRSDSRCFPDFVYSLDSEWETTIRIPHPQGLRSTHDLSRGWHTQCQNQSEQQNIHHPQVCNFGAKTSVQTSFGQSFSRTLQVMDWASAPKIVDVRTNKCVPCGPGDGEKVFWPLGADQKYMFMLFFFLPQRLECSTWFVCGGHTPAGPKR